jgi:hypothetical protein
MSEYSFGGAPCIITHMWKCAKCGREEQTMQQKYALGFEVMTPHPPENWRQFRFKVYCTEHEIKFIIDGEETRWI